MSTETMVWHKRNGFKDDYKYDKTRASLDDLQLVAVKAVLDKRQYTCFNN